MDVIEKLTELLTGKTFSHNGKNYCFLSCKKVVSNIMILTNKETIQVPLDRFDDFYGKVRKNCFDASNLPKKKEFIPAELPMKKQIFTPEISNTFLKLNESFEGLIDLINGAKEDDLKFIEAKTKMLTSVAQTAVNMENSRIGLIKAFNGK